MSGFSSYRRTSQAIFLIAAGLFCAFIARAKTAYLPAVGVPALRFQMESTNYFVFNPKQFEPIAVFQITNSSPATMASASVTNSTNTVTTAAPVTAPAVGNIPSTPPPDPVAEAINIPASYYNSVFSPSAASDLLPVTPQMITQYLKPEQSETNRLDQPGAVVFVPAGVPFTPPEPRANIGSRATYRAQ